MLNNNSYPNIESCVPSNCISGQIMKCNRIIANTFRKYLKPFGITDSQLSILFVITKGTDINQRKLSQILVLDKSTVNRNIKRLFEQKYISLNKGSIITTTITGKQFLEKVIPQWNLAMTEIKDILDHEGINALNIIVNKLNQ